MPDAVNDIECKSVVNESKLKLKRGETFNWLKEKEKKRKMLMGKQLWEKVTTKDQLVAVCAIKNC